jgi:hypothetical protein
MHEFKVEDGEPYYPSNGTEGMGFIDVWCLNCIKDTMIRGGKKQCTILTNSFLKYHVKQWVYKDNRPICTSFVEIGSVKPKGKNVDIKGMNKLF